MRDNIINMLKIILLKKTIGHCLYFFIGKFDVRKSIQLLGNYFFSKWPWWRLFVLCIIVYKLYWYLCFFPYSVMILIGASLLYYFFMGQK